MSAHAPRPEGDASLTRRHALRGLLLPAAGLIGGCAAGQKSRTDITASASSVEIPEGLGTFVMNPDGTRSFKDHVLRDQDGNTLRFQSDLMKGHIFAANFMYVHCKGICQNMTTQMSLAYDLLQPIMGNPARFYSFSLAEDSPEDMKEYMIARGIYGRPGWLMLTAPREVVRDIRWGFGFFDPNEEIDQDLNGHTGMARFGNQKTDKWSACPALGSPQIIARGVLGVMPVNERPQLAGITREADHPARRIPTAKPAT